MTDHTASYRAIHRAITEAKEVLLIAHQKPDGDTLGANLAMANWLRDQGKHFHIFCAHPVPSHYQFLPLWEHVKSTEEEIAHIPFNVVVALDSSSLDYAGATSLVAKLKGSPTIINIDHHGTNPHFGDMNIVEPTASSCSELVYKFLDHHRIHISQEIATCLLTGILTDTGGFSNLGTTTDAVEIAGTLMRRGAKFRTITENTVRNKSVNTLKLWGIALDRLTQHADGLVSTVITQADLDACGAVEEDMEGVANFLNALQDARMVMVLKEREGVVKGSLRTTQADVDVAEYAKKHFGGGGHKKAAGFAVPGHLVQTPDGWRVQPNT
ncbi:MAG: DHH family phosphoesterase [Patescibacteria group bacterium]